MKQIRPFIGKDVVKVLTGIRRSGKSIMLELLCKEINFPHRSILMNFESKKNSKYLKADALYDYITRKVGDSKEKFYLFFDEIQEVQKWEEAVSSFRVDFDADIYITGSNAKLLSGELATYIAGRYVQFVIYPFSFEEFREINKDHTFMDYLEIGGMPFLNSIIDDKNAIKVYLDDVYNSIILKDVVKRNNIRDVDLLERIITYILANIGQTFSATSIAKYFKNEQRKVSTDTVLNYIRACEDAYLFYQIKRQEIKGKKILSVNEKYYVADHGLREAVYGKNNQDIERVLENIVCLELLRRGYKVTVGIVDAVKEIDFIAVRNNKPVYIQVCYYLIEEATKEREFGNLEKINDNYPKYVISMDEFDMSRNGIRHLNIEEFLGKEGMAL
jgi:predicted AAA+ superfamily ATPase